MKRSPLLLLVLFLYSLPLFAKVVVISDIDDTLKKANSMGKIGGAYHFLKKVPYLEMRDLFNEINHHYSSVSNEEIKFFYVSAAPEKLFNAQKWLYKNDFPYGESFLKTTKATTYDFKHETIKKIISSEISSDPNLKVLMFGDNAQVDQIVYNDLKKEMNLDAEIYIRDVRAEATYFDEKLPVKKLPNTTYYFSEIELFNSFNYLTSDLLNQVREEYKEKKLIPKYTLHTLKERLESFCKKLDIRCQIAAENRAKDYWEDYYSRF